MSGGLIKFSKQPRKAAKDYERELIAYWKEQKIFEKSVRQRPGGSAYVFYDGPPFITGVPHHGTLLSSVVKDAVPRFWTMKGKRVERVWGWDCHGLPAENFVEKKLGIKDKRDVYKIGLEKYILACRASMIQTGSEWEDTIDRIGRWVDFKGAYKTMDPPYMESVWWAFKRLYEAGKIYEGEKVLLYCTRDATPISKAEVAMDNSYREVTDPAVFVKLKLKDEDASLLAWTTTPWTLPANAAAAVNAAEHYAYARVNGERLVLAEKLLDKVLSDDQHKPLDYQVEQVVPGRELVGKRYRPLFDDRGENAHKVWAAPYVTLEEGTGIVHLAPAYGEEDYELAKAHGVPIISLVDENGFYTEGAWRGQLIWDANKRIAKKLLGSGQAFKVEYVTHSYPHCHRCGTKLMYRAHPSWFINIDRQRERMLELNGSINWFPAHFKRGRFANNVRQAPDWNISRDRFWATPMPVWKGKGADGEEKVKVVGSYEELERLSGRRLDDYHRPWIDDVTFELDGVTYRRIDKVLDSWLEAGSMPYAQFHYPFENKEKFEANFPGDFIAEYVGQVRAWFYYLHAVSTALFDSESFKNVIVTGTISGNDGRKMSKSLGNYTDPNELMDRFSADALRFFFLSSPLLNGEDVSLLDKDVADIHRKLQMLWNVFDFFSTYAGVDGWQWDGRLEDPLPDLSNVLDKWIVSKAHQLIQEVGSNMEAYNIPRAAKPITEFLEDLSNWYVRRSRRRFWKSGSDTDKTDAYKSLHYVMVQLTKVMAPFTPFMAEAVFRLLTGRESVHLEDWPAAVKLDNTSHIILEEMKTVRLAVAEGLAQRAAAGIKVRQPLASVSLALRLQNPGDFEQIIADELNVKEVIWAEAPEATNVQEAVKINTEITDQLRQEGIMRDLVRLVQNARKNAGLNVEDRIRLRLESDNRAINRAFKNFKPAIFGETLAQEELPAGHQEQYAERAELDGSEIRIWLARL